MENREHSQISRLQQDLQINHFHEVGAGALAEKLYDAGYRLIPELKMLSDEEIQDTFASEESICTTEMDMVKAGAQAELDSIKKQLGLEV